MAENTMQIRLVSPEGVLFEGSFDALTLPAHDGLLGVLPGHAPFVGKLGVGLMTIHSNGDVLRFGLYGGFFTISQGRADIVVDRADLPEALEPGKCQEELEALSRPRRRDVDAFEEDQRRIKIARMRVTLADSKTSF